MRKKRIVYRYNKNISKMWKYIRKIEKSRYNKHVKQKQKNRIM